MSRKSFHQVAITYPFYKYHVGLAHPSHSQSPA